MPKGWWDVRPRDGWSNLSRQVSSFDLASAGDAVATRDARIRKHRAVIRFTISGLYLAAIYIRNDGDPSGNWYTTISDELSHHLPLGRFTAWSDIRRHGSHIQVVTSWATLPVPTV
jgi:hypothetical protein